MNRTGAESTREVLVETIEGRIRVLSPGVGAYVPVKPAGGIVEPGGPVGLLLVLGRVIELRLPAGHVGGVIVSAPSELRRTPVDRGAVLLDLDPAAVGQVGSRTAAADQARAEDGSLPVPSPQSGRFYDRPSPDAAAFVKPGDELHPGQAIGLIEVMKTFNQVVYGGPGLPQRARVVRLEASNEDEVRRGAALLWVVSSDAS